MERKLKPIEVQLKLQRKGVRLFSPEEFRRVFLVTLRAAQEFIKDHTRDLFIKLRNGLYALRMDPPNELEIANRLYQPSYISFEYALHHHHMIPEATYAVTSATTKTTTEFVVQGKSYEYSRLKKAAYRGYEFAKIANTGVLIATPEKALIDYLYFVDLKLKSLNERLSVRKINKKEALRYAKTFGRESLLALLREVL